MATKFELEYERRLATALQECIDVYNRSFSEERLVMPSEVAGIGDIIRGKLARVPWVDVDTTGVQGLPYKSEDMNANQSARLHAAYELADWWESNRDSGSMSFLYAAGKLREALDVDAGEA